MKRIPDDAVSERSDDGHVDERQKYHRDGNRHETETIEPGRFGTFKPAFDEVKWRIGACGVAFGGFARFAAQFTALEADLRALETALMKRGMALIADRRFDLRHDRMPAELADFSGKLHLSKPRN